jgi:CheY-like chemotaxis protein
LPDISRELSADRVMASNNDKIPMIDRKKCNILVADDNQDNIEILSNYLTSKGYNLRLASNGREAIEAAQDYLPDLIIMDIRMPEMGRLEATRRQRKIPHFIDTPIIALSASAELDMVTNCIEAGCDVHLSKPIDFAKLDETIERSITNLTCN